MKAAIIQCDSAPGELEPEFGTYSGMVVRMLESVDADLEFQVFDAKQNEYPDDLDAWDFFITTGSKAGAWEDLPWIHRLISFVQCLDRQEKKLVGICFGHQIIAAARGGLVEKSAKGWGVGIARNRVNVRREWMKTPKDELNIIVSHQDQITRLPEDSLVVASSDFCPFFAVQWGDHFLGIQGHPEWLPGYSKALIHYRRDILGEPLAEAGLASLNLPPDNALFARWILDFVSS